MINLKFLKENLNSESQFLWDDIKEEYLTQLNLVSLQEFGLPVDVEFDNNETYKQCNVPFSLYFRNSYLKEDNWLPIEIDNPYKFAFNTECLNISLSDYYSIREFVIKYSDALKLVCENKISSLKFLKTCSNIVSAYNKPLNEMAALHQDDTGLPEKIWIDCGSTYKKGSHWIRIKAGNTDLATLTIPEYKWIGGSNISDSHKKLIEKYVKINVELITKATMGQISFSDYLANAIKVDSKGLPISKMKVNEWLPYLFIGDLTILKRNKYPVKYIVVRQGETESSFKQDDGQTIMFDSIFYLGEKQNKCFCTIGEQQFWLYGDGTLKEIEN